MINPMNIAFLGAGKMAGAIIRGLLRAGRFQPSEIMISDRVPAATESVASESGVSTASSNTEAIEFAEVVLLCVKPDDARQALHGWAKHGSGKLLISIVTGLSCGDLEEIAHGARVVRVMPNTAALVGASVSVICSGRSANANDKETAEQIFAAVGSTLFLEETKMDAVTALSGSGPAFIYLAVESLSDGGVRAGLPREIANKLAIGTLSGASRMLEETEMHPALLREMVTSPAGTTAAGLQVLEEAAVRSAFSTAVASAAARARELADS